jgi:hypothetical protein
MDNYQGQNTDPASLHKYLYVEADPANRIDPSGHFSLLETMQIIAVRAIVFAAQHPRITFGIHVGLAATNLVAFIADKQFRNDIIGAFGANIFWGGRSILQLRRRNRGIGSCLETRKR